MREMLKSGWLMIIALILMILMPEISWSDNADYQITPLKTGQRKIFVKFDFSGDTYGLQSYYPAYFRNIVQETGMIKVCAWGNEISELNSATDTFRDSGRYKENQKPPKGQYEVPEEYYKITVDCTVEQLTGAVNIPFSVDNYGTSTLNIGGSKTAIVNLAVERYDPITATADDGFNSTGKKTGLQGVGVYVPNVNLGAGLYNQNFEKSLVGKAARSATMGFINQILKTK